MRTIPMALSGFVSIAQQPFDGFIKFDGVDDQLSIQATSALPYNGDFTIEFWFKTCTDTVSLPQNIFGIDTQNPKLRCHKSKTLKRISSVFSFFSIFL